MIKRCKKVILIMLLSLSGIGQLSAQNQSPAKIDSLLTELSRAKEDTNKVWLLCNLVFEYDELKMPGNLKYGQTALALAKKLNSPKAIARSWDCLGLIYFQQRNYTEAQKISYLKLDAARKAKDRTLITEAYNQIIYVYILQKKYFNAIEFCENEIHAEREKGNNIEVAVLYNYISNIYGELNEYPKSIDYNLKSLAILNANDSLDLLLQVQILSNIAVFYQRLNQYDKAIEYSLLGIQKAKQIDNKWTETNMYGNLALVYTKLKQFTLSIPYAFKSLDMAKEMGDSNLLGVAMLEIGNAYLLMVKDTAMAGVVVKGENSEYDGKQLNERSIPAGNPARLQIALYYLHQALSIKEKIGDEEMVQHIYHDLSDAHRLHHDYKAALEYQTTYLALKDSLSKKEHETHLESKLMQRDFEKQKTKANAELQIQKTVRNAFIAGFAVMLLFAGVFFNQRNKIKHGKKRSDELLLNILPAEVAEELKDTGSSKAKNFNEATVMFTDFKDFTHISEKMSAEDLVKEIDTCFSAFDNIIQQYGIEKIKTIGDAYMCAGGLPNANTSHADDVVKAALDIRDFMARHNKEKLMHGEIPFEIRIGINTGPVVAGIVGVKKFAYDIWGDTVNVANRMESHGEAGKVNISESTYDLVKAAFSCTHRGKIMTKSKGEIDMYFVEHRDTLKDG